MSPALLHPSSTSLLPALIYLLTLGCQLLVPFAPSLQAVCPQICILVPWHEHCTAPLLQDPWDVFYEGATLQITPLKWKLLISKHGIKVLSL